MKLADREEPGLNIAVQIKKKKISEEFRKFNSFVPPTPKHPNFS